MWGRLIVAFSLNGDGDFFKKKMPFGRSFWLRNMGRMFVSRFIGLGVLFQTVFRRGGKTFVVLMRGMGEVGSQTMLDEVLVMVLRLVFGLIVGRETLRFVIASRGSLQCLCKRIVV
jgi:hypothetical protein